MAPGATCCGSRPESPRALRDMLNGAEEFVARFELPVKEGEIPLMRTHPYVEGMAQYILDTALDAEAKGVARRCAVIRTSAVPLRTTLLLVRFRFHIHAVGDEGPPLLAEDIQAYAFRGNPQEPEWLQADAVEPLLSAEPSGNVVHDQAVAFLQRVLDAQAAWMPMLDAFARRRGQELLAAHRRVRQAARMRGRAPTIEPHLPPDVLGIYLYLPLPAAAEGGS